MEQKQRLIDANDLVRCCEFAKSKLADNDSLTALDLLIKALKQAPTVDAVAVVRCKDCKHFSGHGACHCHAADENGTPIFVREEDFCSYGERRTDGSEG